MKTLWILERTGFAIPSCESKKGAALHTGWPFCSPILEININEPRARKRICSGSMELIG
jgi:hypothetical protein